MRLFTGSVVPAGADSILLQEDATRDGDRVTVEPLAAGFWRVQLHFGFMDVPDVPRALQLADRYGLHIPLFETTYFLSRENIVPGAGSGPAQWRDQLFAAMSRNASGIAHFLRLPDNAVVELGTRVQI